MGTPRSNKLSLISATTKKHSHTDGVPTSFQSFRQHG